MRLRKKKKKRIKTKTAVDIFVESKGQLGISCDTSHLVALIQRTALSCEWMYTLLWLMALHSQLHDELTCSHCVM